MTEISYFWLFSGSFACKYPIRRLVTPSVMLVPLLILSNYYINLCGRSVFLLVPFDSLDNSDNDDHPAQAIARNLGEL